jgi:hypothetical protein
MKLFDTSFILTGRTIHIGSCSGEGAEGVRWKESDQQVTGLARAAAWNAIADSQLIAWGRDPGQLEEDGIQAPAEQTIARATELASRLRVQGVPAPTRIVPTGDGGIAFQFEDDSRFTSIEIGDDGVVELYQFEESRLILRQVVATFCTP